MELAFASGPLYAAHHQPTSLVAATLLIASLWLVAVVVVRTFILLNLLWAWGRSRAGAMVSMRVLPFFEVSLPPPAHDSGLSFDFEFFEAPVAEYHWVEGGRRINFNAPPPGGGCVFN